MGRHVAADCPELDRLVDDACAAIGREIEALKAPHLSCVVLGGGYGRGEGGVREKLEGRVGVGERNNSTFQPKTPTLALSNDLDFFAITDDGAPEADSVTAIGAALKPISEKWTAKLGVDVDFTVKTPWRLKHDEERIMVQELLRGYFDVAGVKGDRLFSGIERRPAEAIPWMEAARLLMNRGMGLLFAMKEESRSSKLKLEKGTIPISNSNSRLELYEKRDFVNRNINKCILGVGDARLVARRAYAWRAVDRAKALGDALYDSALEWKFRPADEPVCCWEKAREAWLAAVDEVSFGSRHARDSRGSRTLRSAARWLARRRTVGELRTLGLDPVVRILETVSRHVRSRRAPDASLMRDWEVFN